VQNRVSRVARGWIAVSYATGVAAVGHGLVDGSAPSTLAVVVGLVFAGLLGTFAIGRRPSLPRLAIVVAGSQVAFHLVFSWLIPGTSVTAGRPTASLCLVLLCRHSPRAARSRIRLLNPAADRGTFDDLERSRR